MLLKGNYPGVQMENVESAVESDNPYVQIEKVGAAVERQ